MKISDLQCYRQPDAAPDVEVLPQSHAARCYILAGYVCQTQLSADDKKHGWTGGNTTVLATRHRCRRADGAEIVVTLTLPGSTRDEALGQLDVKAYEFKEWLI